MPTLNELMNKFASAETAEEQFETGGDFAPENDFAVDNDGTTKIASGGESMHTLMDIYNQISGQDMDKTAHAAAEVPYYGEEYVDENQELDFAKMAEDLAGAEADDLIAEDYPEQTDIIKVASEYDAAGRIMARGFYDEFSKLAGNMDTDVTPNQNTENPSTASTPSLGDRGLPTVPTNYAGSPNNDQNIETAGQGGKQVYKDVLKPAKTISAGQGTGDDPEAMATSLGGGSPAGAFATVRDLANGGAA